MRGFRLQEQNLAQTEGFWSRIMTPQSPQQEVEISYSLLWTPCVYRIAASVHDIEGSVASTYETRDQTSS